MLLLLTAFSATALVLAIVGIYGALAYSVVQRRAELGIRLALGAEKFDILRLVVKQGVVLTLLGIVIGTLASIAVAVIFPHWVSSSLYLYKVKAFDLPTFVLAPLIFIVIGALASYLPALRATRVDPTEALRGN
jgi:ABC-type antimicrobial peptide transport system permease subunit